MENFLRKKASTAEKSSEVSYRVLNNYALTGYKAVKEYYHYSLYKHIKKREKAHG